MQPLPCKRPDPSRIPEEFQPIRYARFHGDPVTDYPALVSKPVSGIDHPAFQRQMHQPFTATRRNKLTLIKSDRT